MQIDVNPDKWKKWRFLKLILLGRLISPFEHPEFIFYFLFIVVVIGGNGIWYSIWYESHQIHPVVLHGHALATKGTLSDASHKNIIFCLVSYALALMTSGSADLLLSKTKSIKGVIIMLGVSLLITSVVLFIAAIMSDVTFGYRFGVGAVILSLFTWWISNAEKPEFIEPEKGEEPGSSFNSLGGPPPINGDAGNSAVVVQGDLSVVTS